MGDSWLIMDSLVGQEEKSTAALKSQIEKLQQERNEFQRMVIANPSLAGNEKREADPSQYPLGEKTDVFDLPFRMARGQIVESLRAKMAFIKESIMYTRLPKSKQLKLLCLKIGDNYGLNKDDK
ncbi:hypothetical protein Bca52824_051623 [Brassica carinata]|uniref:Uncharacterized protein n=1 Tax=Brassica carinata TaxID=52824 RepID=A0A8X7R0I8_BRACI|nr:hypothetical protein Bca52824_051623 [Brassica carinata]